MNLHCVPIVCAGETPAVIVNRLSAKVVHASKLVPSTVSTQIPTILHSPAQVTCQLSLLRRSRAPGQQTITPFQSLLLQQRAPVVPSSQPSFLQAFSPLLEAGHKDSASAVRLRQASTSLSLVLSRPLTAPWAVPSQKATLKFLQLMVS